MKVPTARLATRSHPSPATARAARGTPRFFFPGLVSQPSSSPIRLDKVPAVTRELPRGLLFIGMLLLGNSLLFGQTRATPVDANRPGQEDPPPATRPLIAGFERFHAEHPEESLPAGTLLATELGCAACHLADDRQLTPKSGPDLTGLRERIDLDWVRDFLQRPHQIKPGTTMPDLLAGEPAPRRRKKVEALIHYLESLPGKPEHFQLNRPPLEIVHPQFWDRGDVTAGQELFHRIGCVACHAPDETFAGAASSAPDAERQLRELGLDDEEIQELLEDSLPDTAPVVPLPRLHRKYSSRSLSFFLLQPLVTRPSGRMPDLRLTPAESADLAAYLRQRSEREEVAKDQPPAEDSDMAPPRSSLPPLPSDAEMGESGKGSSPLSDSETTSGEGVHAFVRPDPELVESGRSLFQSLGCVHCHAVPDAETIRVFTPWEKLSERSQTGCLAEQPSSGTPHFGLSTSQRIALWGLFVSPPAPTEEHEAAADNQFALNLMLEQLNCLACHQRDQRGGVGADRWRYFETIDHIDLGDEGRIPPALDRVGWKLTTSWLKQVLTDGRSVRPHMLARMPRFGQQLGEVLPGLLESVDQVDRLESKTERTKQQRGEDKEREAEVSHASPAVEKKSLQGDVESGRQLLDVGCIQCHPIRGEQLPGVIGIDLNSVVGRLQRDWFLAFVRDPAALKPGTRMPTFFPGGISNSPEIADGDVDRQIASLWEYLHATDEPPLPDRLSAERLHNFELTPTDTPLILRTFMEEVGTHAIAVGFPGEVALAYDAWNLRPAIAWKGRFLDAHPIWFDRFSPPTPPLGDQRIELPRVPLLAQLDSEQSPWPPAAPPPDPRAWKGYHLDEAGVPTFRYRWKAYRIEDRFAPRTDGEGLQRTIRIEWGSQESTPGDSPENTQESSHENSQETLQDNTEREELPDQRLWICLHEGLELMRHGNEVRDAQGLRVRLRTPGDVAEASRVRAMVPHGEEVDSAPERGQWILPLLAASHAADEVQQPEPEATAPNEPVLPSTYLIELEYRW